MRSLLLVVAAVVSGQYYTGDGTTYGPPDGGDSAFTGNCALMKPLDLAVKFHAAMNNDQWQTGIHCGRCVEVQCVDPRCTSREKVLGQVTDRCPECKYGDLDMGYPMFNKITGFSTDRLQIKWQFVNCPVSGGVQVCAKAGSSKYWLYIQASNALNGVQSMAINGGPAPSFDSAYYFMSQRLGVELSQTQVAMTSFSGETISTTVSLQADQCTQIPLQFTQGVVPGPPVPPPQPTTRQPAPTPSPTTQPPTSAPTTDAPTTQPPTPAPTQSTPATTTGTPVATTDTTVPTTTSVAVNVTLAPVELPEVPQTTLPPVVTAVPSVEPAKPQPTKTTDANIVSVQASAAGGTDVTSYLVAGGGLLVVVAAVALVYVVKRSRQKYLQEKESDASFDGPIMRYGQSETTHANVAIL
ncbi:hypothetical protein ACHHYP_02353 [Achlya hypogyna]|uniref:Expansin-like EG45 domain-containing protein n=1 Tax=Achlya hypogyna TaxID=1202772 RepID=A0A1V9Z6P3_ACHHY|nr:hypothetical protein ACHHYP_02353 [Achlya hypogyna]